MTGLDFPVQTNIPECIVECSKVEIPTFHNVDLDESLNEATEGESLFACASQGKTEPKLVNNFLGIH